MPLTERVIEGIIDHLWCDTQPRGGAAVELNRELQSSVLLVAAHITKLWVSIKRFDEFGGEGVKLIEVRVLKGILILGTGRPRVNSKVLYWLNEQRDPFDLRQFRLKSPDYLAGVHLPLCKGLKVNKNPSAIERDICSVYTNER